MGLCTSCESTMVATAKLVLQDGRLQEFSYPVKVAYILSKEQNVFICNADEMEFDHVLTAVNENAELEPGQLYFALPLSKLSRPLQAEEMAALAVKANAALMKSTGGEKCGCGKKKGGFFSKEKDYRSSSSSSSSSSKVADLGSATVRSMRSGNRSRNGNGNGNGRRRMFLANLSVISE